MSAAYTFDPHHRGSGHYWCVMPDGTTAIAQPDVWGWGYIVFLNDGSPDGGYRDGFSNAEAALEALEDIATDMIQCELLTAALSARAAA